MKTAFCQTIVTLLLAGSSLPAATHYVSQDSASPTLPYTNWATAAHVIQDAVDAAAAGDEIVVANGTYSTGGRPVGTDALVNRVALDKPVTVRSVNGPQVTTIEGYQLPGHQYGDGAVRCAYVTEGALLAGFTLTGGATRGWSQTRDSTGGGAWSAGVLSNCVIAGNVGYFCAGAYGGTLRQCTITGNGGLGVNSATLIDCNITTNSFCGAVYCTLTNCTLAGNVNNQPGGGVHDSTLCGCTLIGNSAYQGAGAANSTLYKCRLIGNTGGEGGGAWQSKLQACTVASNTASWRGGGVFQGTLNGSALTGNSAASYGGGAYGATMNNCTLTGNSVTRGSGGGAYGCGLANCIVYFNTACGGENYDVSSSGSLNDCCTTPLPAGGTGNIAQDPQLASDVYLSDTSPCRAAGSAAYATGMDIDGQAWGNPPSIGCAEYRAGATTGALTVRIAAGHTNIAVGYSLGVTALIQGRTTASVWDFGDGSVISNRPYATHTWAVSGDYAVALTAYNDSLPGGVSATCTVHVASRSMHYVAAASATPQPPFSSWATAAREIQDAVDAATLPGAWVVVSNGTYSSGGRTAGAGVLFNRVAVDKPLSLISLNGPEVTIIQGQGGVRCLYLSNGASVSGFTLAKGAASISTGDSNRDRSGGGVWCESNTALISNCVLVSNSASYYGGAAYGGTLNNCTLSGNSAGSGGAAYSASLNNCWIWANSALNSGGGTYGSALNGCAVAGNSASAWGGGASGGTLNNCTLAGNSASSGGGASGCALYNCIVYFNSAPASANYDSSCGVNYCCTTPLPMSGAGNMPADPLLASLTHLSTGSPCRGAGSPSYCRGTDLDGEPWVNPPSMGCDEYYPGAVTGPLSVSVLAARTNVGVGFAVGLTGLIEGRTSGSIWDFGDGSVVSNRPCVTHDWTNAGSYTVTLRADNEGQPGGVIGAVTIQVTPVVHYVSAASANPLAPYKDWGTAARTIQDAVDAAVIPGAVVLVSNGLYAVGGRAVGTNRLINRVAVTKPIAIRSVNGPQFTSIQGSQVGLVTNGNNATRCVYLANGASLSGFTLSRGATRTDSGSYLDVSGGGVCCDSTNALVTNCVLTGNAAYGNGGAAFGGTLNKCTLYRNWTPMFGGGAYGSVLNNCTISSNWGDSGGGVYNGTMNNCVLTGNTAGGFDGFGGGARRASLKNCTLVGNQAWMGGGASGYPDSGSCSLLNCILYQNTASYSGPNYDSACAVSYCWTGDPLFVGLADGNLRLQSVSPCINAGNNDFVTTATDMDGNPRIVNALVDIGAYEYQGYGSRISYAWLQQYGLPTDGSADLIDSDSDGMNNWQEWVCGTCPTNPLSALRVLSALRYGTNVSVTWESVSGVNYYLQRSTNLASPFTQVASFIAGQAGTTSYTDTNAAGASQGSYRVGVLPSGTN